MLERLFKTKFPDIEPETSKHTTDVPELERCATHHLFVIDDLQRGRRNHKVLNQMDGNVEWIATGFTEAHFHCWKRVSDDAEALTIPLPKKDQRTTTEWTEFNKFNNRFEHWGKIKGELWKVHSSTVVRLDTYMLNNIMYKRQRVIIEVPLKEVTPDGVKRTISEQEAFMYIGIPEIWEPLLDGGYLFRPMTIFNNSSLNRKYYSYTLLEDQED